MAKSKTSNMKRNKLTPIQLKLQRDIIMTVCEIFATDEYFNANLNLIRDGEWVTVEFTYHDNLTRDMIFELKRILQDELNVYFDSGFGIQRPVIDWSLDWSIDSIENEKEESL